MQRNLREISERGERLSHYAEEARHRYKHHHDSPYELHQNMQPLSLAQNEAFADAMMEENEKERALELYRVQEEQSLKEEYDRKISELTKDYKAKLMDLDRNYADKKLDLDRERAEIERKASIASQLGQPEEPGFALEDPNFGMDPQNRPLRRIGMADEVPEAETQTFNDTEFGFEIDPAYIGMNLAHRRR